MKASEEFHTLARYSFHPTRAENLLAALDATCKASGLKRHDCLVVVARLLAIILRRWREERTASHLEPVERHIAMRIVAGPAPAAREGEGGQDGD